MDRMLVVVFGDQSTAYKGKEALQLLDSEGSIKLYAYAVVAKNQDGTATVKQSDDASPLGALAGTSLGSLIGLLGGPVGLAIGATVGFLTGATADIDNARVGADFVDDVTKVLLPGRVAVVAQVDEEWTTPVDTRMEPLGGIVFRRALSDVQDTVDDEEVAGIKADMAQMKAELAQGHVDRKAKIQEKINQLDSKLQARLQLAKDRRQAAEREAQAKVQVLKAKAASARSNAS
jgi:uncharacterized membrane protein